MVTYKQINLLNEFKQKCLQQNNKLPDAYLQSFINGNNLMFNLTLFRTQDYDFAKIIFSLPFQTIIIFQNDIKDCKQIKSNENIIKQDNQKIKNQQTQKVCHVFRILNELLSNQNNKVLRNLKFQNLIINQKQLQLLVIGIQKTKYLKKLTFSMCDLQDIHLQILKNSISSNISLTCLDFSFNKLRDSEGIISKILQAHCSRKNQIRNLYLTRNSTPDFNIADTGISQINLEGNQLSNKGIHNLIILLSQDQWIRSINLKNNNLNEEEVKAFTALIVNNSTLLNLDIRQNEGFNKKYSKIIFSKLKQNILNFKNQQQLSKNQQLIKKKLSIPNLTKNKSNNSSSKNQSILRQNSNSFRQFNKQPILTQQSQILSKQKINTKISINSPQGISSLNHYYSHKKMNQNKSLLLKKQKSNKFGLIALNKNSLNKNLNNTASVLSISKNSLKKSKNKKQTKRLEQDMNHLNCDKCKQFQMKALLSEQKYRQMQLKALKAQKQNVQLQIQLRKLRNFLTKNMDVSAIGSSSNRLSLQNPPQLNFQNSNISTSFNRLMNIDNEDDMITKIQVLVSQLTKIMETVELFQNTQYTIQHLFENVNSFSKTVSLYQKPKELMQIHQQILEDEALHLQQFGDNSESIIQKVDTYENIQKVDKNQSIQ